MHQYLVLGLVLQCVMVTTGHYVPTILSASAFLGVGIPLALGVTYGCSRSKHLLEAARGGFAIGLTGASVGVLLAILMGDQPWILLTYAPASSAVAGALGAGLSFATHGRRHSACRTVAG